MHPKEDQFADLPDEDTVEEPTEYNGTESDNEVQDPDVPEATDE